MTILIERRLGTAPFWMPVERGWLEPSQEVKIVESLTPADLRAHDGVMIVDTLLASTVLEGLYDPDGSRCRGRDNIAADDDYI